MKETYDLVLEVPEHLTTFNFNVDMSSVLFLENAILSGLLHIQV